MLHRLCVFVAWIFLCPSTLSPTLAVDLPSSSPNPTRVGWVDEPDDGRGTASILWQCLSTIFLCLVVIPHLNTPPKLLSVSQSLRRRINWVIMGFFAPELICVNAVEQYWNARQFRNRVALQGIKLSLRQSFFVALGGLGFRTLIDSPSDVPKNVKPAHSQLKHPGEDVTEQSKKEVTASSTTVEDPVENKLPEAPKPKGEDIIRIYGRKPPGFQIVPAKNWEQDALRFCAHHCPTDDEIQALAKEDTVGKLVTFLQALWTLCQIIARRCLGIHVSLLEYLTPAYLVLSTISYAAWFGKPYNVEHIFVRAVRGDTDDLLLPAFLNGDGDAPQLWCTTNAEGGWLELDDIGDAVEVDRSDSISLPLSGIIFSGIPFLAWNHSFPTVAELWLWRANCISVGALLPVFVLLLWKKLKYGWNAVDPWISLFCLVLYSFGRLYLLLECFIELRSAPVGIYQSVDWIKYLPHFGL